ncbi:FAD-binding and (Fe-S)-binding domain-containing protein [Chelativorans salis]|uniref:FAD-binding protein n=1 Tax=Chelativorans salis TaxID=2978478 RepID=A0ABT2LP90_9HYPH|nr:FAD-binding and (Fe-S)-binding domain-containing protein [Chelativorans sp. EGI FJ00035]MCT7376277.1 FAD-binding protein [Chelativorans sp. EGI FJ00035]
MANIRAEPPSRPSDEAVAALVADLERRIRGEVRFRTEDQALYSTDASNYRQVPIGVVIPCDEEDAVEAVACCREHGVPILPRGCGTSLSGETCNVAVVLDFSKYHNRVLDIDYENKRARVQSGTIFDDLRGEVERNGLTVAFDTSTHAYATIGGMVGNNSCGVHSVLAEKMGAGSGRTEDNIHELEVLTYDGLRLKVGPTPEDELERIIREGGRRGEIYGRLKALRDKYADLIRERYPQIPRRVSGYSLPQLLPEHGFNVARALVGTEGTCVTVLDATVGLVESPPARVMLVLGYPDVYATGDHVPEVRASGPVGLEAIDARLIENMRRKGLHTKDLDLLPEGGGWLLAEFGGENQEEAEAQARELMDALGKGSHPPSMRLITSPEEQTAIWHIRESGLGATAFVPGREDNWPGWEDSAVPPERVGEYLRDLKALFDRYDYSASLYGHFGQGCIHCRINFDVRTSEGVAKWRSFMDDAADLVVRYGGSFSGEHGDGQARAALLPKLFGEELVNAFREFKAIWDPEGRMNPGKVVDPYPITAHLQAGPDYRPPKLDTHFAYPEDEGSFARAISRCVGVGKCRMRGGQVMCPSFMATREEEHTTRGRAHSLFEMLHGGPIKDGWKSEEVHEALDLCLACKGCKSDCPINVDMATYKAEFMAHYYEGRRRPVHMYSMGLIYWWARAASRMPGTANFFTRTEPFAAILKRVGGIATERQMPAFASPTLTTWFRRRSSQDGVPGGRRVLLWPDTFTNYLTPEPGKAAVEVLEAAGYRVEIPPRPLCCGRPLYAIGMLDRAKKLWRQTLDHLRPAIREGVPLVGVEPSCVAAFRDELVNLSPDDEDARTLSNQTFLLSEFLREEGFEPPRLERRALVHYHCNHHAIMGKEAENEVLDALGLDHRDLNAGCCGMAGPFGFEADHYDVSIKCGERVLLPAVRRADPDALVIANGFSCREQIAQCTGRQAVHLAEVLRMAMNGDAA